MNTRYSIYLLMGWLCVSCQSADPVDWQHLDLEKDGVFGISADRAYDELLHGKPSVTTIVAVLDAGFDVDHEDLRGILWVNQGEIPGNGIDDDGNGFVDDIHGWNFAGDADSTFHYDNAELTRLVRLERQQFADHTVHTVAVDQREAFIAYQARESELARKLQEAREKLVSAQAQKATLDEMVARMGKESPTLKDFRNFAPQNQHENRLRSLLNARLQRMGYADFYADVIEREVERQWDAVHYSYNLAFDPGRGMRVINGDTLLWLGNSDLRGQKPLHGTHIAGIIGADRENNLGIRGIADNVRVMPIRLGYGGIRDEDIARGIRYAVDHGAKVINMSFGKEDYTLNREWVEEAMRYAESKDVLLIQATGNSDHNMDEKVTYPTRYYAAGDTARNWITVAASDHADDETLKASFSNYGKQRVDVFAPGVRIRSTIPDNDYKALDGTSMAAPVVAGLAAMIRSYYPELRATQVREIILKSVVQSDRLSARSATGGVVNAYRAIQMAETYIATNSSINP